MLLNERQLREITKGIVEITCSEDGYYTPHRFDETQREIYRTQSMDCKGFYEKCHASAGVRFLMDTDSETLSFDIRITAGSSRRFYGFDLYLDGVFADHIHGTYEERVTDHVSFSLGKGSKRVCLYFPWSSRTEVKNVRVDDGATVSGVPTQKRMLCFGDSITQGYDARYPSLAYTARIADALGVEAVNKGIGADRFFPALLTEPERFKPDYITVAYGTNDWYASPREVFLRDSRAFIERLCALYPTAKIYVLAPLWRADWQKVTAVGAFSEVHAQLVRICADKPCCRVIDCSDITPRFAEFYSDKELHPNDRGFMLYAEGLLRKDLGE